MAADISVTKDIAATPEELWDRVANVERMGEHSPETLGCEWLKGATGPVVGARFKGNNQNGKKKWSTTCTVVESDPGKVFAFDVTSGPVKIARWTYRFEPTEGGCRVTEVWTDQRGWVGKTFGKPISGVGDRESHNRESMVKTLDRLATAAESTT